MTVRYTDPEWVALIRETEKAVKVATTPYPVPPLESGDFAKLIDHTLLKLDATPAQIDGLCDEARREGFMSVCVRQNYVERCVENLKGSGVVVACVIGFHEGTYDINEKSNEALAAISSGATELDIVINYPKLLSGAYNEIYIELATLRNLCATATLKLILETSQLPPPAIVAGTLLCTAAHFDFVKTSTGFNGRGATIDDVRLMRAVCELHARNAGGGNEGGGTYAASTTERRRTKVKASGGLKGVWDVIKMVEAGAERIGTSSGVWIMQEARAVRSERDRVSSRDGPATGMGSTGKGQGQGQGLTRLYTDESVTEGTGGGCY
ncbi:aldolase [Patellaria atrata CBS 101060]|uniref:deoxyribose-phosphate aldolase n=1 Tax=Patellaria atrata CBS 101060 TaxID=1346257 RepID=A0A9P4SAE8_9PEZI|nr:aldolase [Patellaria atrata CBS 101060]